MDILVTLDSNYMPQLKVLLTSLYVNHPNEKFNVYLLHSKLEQTELDTLAEQIKRFNYTLIPLTASEDSFAKAPVTSRYPKEMYYRLLAAQWLPEDMDKILYLDPDILVINPLYELYNTDISDYMFAAAAHTGKTEMANNVNRLRLGTQNDYFNSGVLLMNLKRCRKDIEPDALFSYVEDFSGDLLLPDQDVLNALYGDEILEVDDALWNYDARNYSNYLLRSGGEENMEWVMDNTAILHFCGKEKPWKKNYLRRFGILYRHYMSLERRYLEADKA